MHLDRLTAPAAGFPTISTCNIGIPKFYKTNRQNKTALKAESKGPVDDLKTAVQPAGHEL